MYEFLQGQLLLKLYFLMKGCICNAIIAEAIFEEIACDSVARMNFFEYEKGYYDEATGRLNQMVRDYAWASEKEIAKAKETRGSPTETAEFKNDAVKKAYNAIQNSNLYQDEQADDIKLLSELDKNIADAEKIAKANEGTQTDYNANAKIREYEEQAKVIAKIYEGKTKFSRNINNSKAFQLKFNKNVDSVIPLSNFEKSAIIAKILTGEAGIDESFDYGYIRSYANEYRFFINSDNSITVYDVIDNEELNIHETEIGANYDELYKSRQDGNKRIRQNVQGTENIQRNGSGLFDNGAKTQKQTTTDDVDGRKSEGNTERDISKDKRNSAKFSRVAPETDAKYLTAVENGDTEKEQAMVDEAAVKWGAITDDDGNAKVMFRGGKEQINVFDRKKSKTGNLFGRGFYFTEDKGRAGTYGNV